MTNVPALNNNEEIKINPTDLIESFIEIEKNKKVDESIKFVSLYHLFSSILELATRDEKIQFPTLFSRLAYVGIKNEFSPSFLFYAHSFRRCNQEESIPYDARIALGFYTVSHLFTLLWGDLYRNKHYVLTDSIKSFFFKKKVSFQSFLPTIEALLVEVNLEEFTFTFMDETDSEILKKGCWNVTGRNDLFNQNFSAIDKFIKLPVPINLIDTELSKESEYFPRAIVLQPDFMVDATAISECFKENGSFSMIYLLNKFRDNSQRTPVLMGNIINYLLEEVLFDSKVSLSSLQENLFNRFALSLALLSDSEVKDIWHKIGQHFENIRTVILSDFPSLGIFKENVFLETSFYSKKYGIQGRLDLFAQDLEDESFTIVELKSGSPWRPNVYGISAAHFAQTQVYEMLVKSVHDTPSLPVKNYILYSKESSNTLRFSPSIKPHQWEILKVRNEIIIIEETLKNLPMNPGYLEKIDLKNLPFANGFLGDIVNGFHTKYMALSTLEKQYALHFLAFIAREYSVAKVGEHGIENARGHAALWLETDDQKYNRFSLLSGLKIIENSGFSEDPRLVLSLSKTKQITNFRKGDIAILYPKTREYQAVLHAQLFKCTITSIDNEKVEVKLRNKQNNQAVFEQDYLWNLEEDLVDSSFHKLHESLYTFMGSPMAFRNLFLGITKPQTPSENLNYSPDKTLTSEQNNLVRDALQSRDFFLIWGPPGTGKTSIVLKKITEELIYNHQDHVLLLAYTNRAVDEICQALVAISSTFSEQVVRIGSRVATLPEYYDLLLDKKLQSLHTRRQVSDFIKNTRVFVGTVHSILGKPELFQLKKFDTVIIDEASQILEPQLCGLLQLFSRRILIGDHKQLPAVVRQDKIFTKIDNEVLRQAGIHDMSYSLFDRMYSQYAAFGWNHAIGILTQQGRMHVELMEFVDSHFYDNKLKPLPSLSRLQAKSYFDNIPDSHEPFRNRKLFIHAPKSGTNVHKVNELESTICISILKKLKSLFDLNHTKPGPMSIGIITPFRAQIAKIKEDLSMEIPEWLNLITIDTVERYQGGARDIILFSLCVKNQEQLKRITAENQDGLDRKLNVSLTRAKEQVILIGNRDVLDKHDLYRHWIQQARNFDYLDFVNTQLQETELVNN